MSNDEILKLMSTVESRYSKEYQAFKSVSKDLDNLKRIIYETDTEHLTGVDRIAFWTIVECTLRQCAKKLEESHSPTDDEMLEMAKEDRPISRGEIGL